MVFVSGQWTCRQGHGWCDFLWVPRWAGLPPYCGRVELNLGHRAALDSALTLMSTVGNPVARDAKWCGTFWISGQTGLPLGPWWCRVGATSWSSLGVHSCVWTTTWQACCWGHIVSVGEWGLENLLFCHLIDIGYEYRISTMVELKSINITPERFLWLMSQKKHLL